MELSANDACRVAVVTWSKSDGIAKAIHHELGNLGYQPHFWQIGTELPTEIQVVFSFGPYGDFLQIPLRLAKIPVRQRPLLVHWNTEGLPDLRVPWAVMSSIGAWRSWISRPNGTNRMHHLLQNLFLPLVRERMSRFRYLGDYRYVYRKGWLTVFADSSMIYSRLHQEHGLPAIFAPWGGTPVWYADMALERDIDVLWLGKRGSRRRSQHLDQVRQALEARGARVHVVDGVENAFVYGQERTELLNRAKITLNLTRTWYDDNYSRFAMAASNRSLVVSEPLLPHSPAVKPGQHYVSAPFPCLVETIFYHLEQVELRDQITEAAYRLVTTDLSFSASIDRIMKAALNDRMHHVEAPSTG